MKITSPVSILLLFFAGTLTAQFNNFRPTNNMLEGEVLENDPKNANNFSVLIQPVDFKYFSSTLRLGANLEVMYRSPGEFFWANASTGIDYFIHNQSAVISSRPADYSAGDYSKPSYANKAGIGFNFFKIYGISKRRVLISGGFSNIKTYAVVDANHYKCFGLHAGIENSSSYILSKYYFDQKQPPGFNQLNYSSAEVESYSIINCLSIGLHYQTVDHLKIRVNHNSENKIKSNKTYVIYYADVLLPMKRTFDDANVLVSLDSLNRPVYNKLKVSDKTPLSPFGLRLGVKASSIETFGATAAVELTLVPGPNSKSSNTMLSIKLGFSLGFRAKKLVKE